MNIDHLAPPLREESDGRPPPSAMLSLLVLNLLVGNGSLRRGDYAL
jgi:hypothetical protein